MGIYVKLTLYTCIFNFDERFYKFYNLAGIISSLEGNLNLQNNDTWTEFEVLVHIVALQKWVMRAEMKQYSS